MNKKLLQGIIPYPETLAYSGGFFKLTPTTPIFMDSTIEGLGPIISYLAEKIESTTGFLLHQKDIRLQKIRTGIYFTLSAGLDEDSQTAYEIDIEKQAINITAFSLQGLFYGAVTFFHTVCSSFFKTKSQNMNHIKIPCMKIKDWAFFKWRGLLLDCSRHFMSKEFVKMVIDILALYKMNKLHWHLTDDQGWRIEIKKYPFLTGIGGWRGQGENRHGGFYTQDEIREIVKYAESRFVEVVPEIEMPGHAVAALAAYPEFSCTGQKMAVETRWGIFEDVFCAGNAKTYDFLHSILDEVCSLFPSSYIHLGGDEVPVTRWSSCPKCKELMSQKKMKQASELESHLLQNMVDYLKTKKKTAICWDEVTEGVPVRNATVQYWRAFVNEGILSKAASEGYDVIVSPTSHCYLDYPAWKIDTRTVHSLDPYAGLSNEEDKSRIIGVECNMWTEHAPEEWVFQKILPRLLGLAEVGWSGPNKHSFTSLQSRLETQRELLSGMGITAGETISPDLSKPVKTKKPATFTTTMGIHERFIPERAFSKEPNSGFYWTGRPVKKDESFTLTFKGSHLCNSIKVTTQCADIMDNAIKNAVLETSIDGKTFEKVAQFKDGLAEASFEDRKVKAIRIRATVDHDTWIVISDIVIE